MKFEHLNIHKYITYIIVHIGYTWCIQKYNFQINYNLFVEKKNLHKSIFTNIQAYILHLNFEA